MGYINGVGLGQTVMFPVTLDEYVGENNEVRAIGAFIEYLRMDELRFVRSEAAWTGRPGYDPRMLLGIFIWGHLNRIRSSRQLERECGRNVELMWLSGLLRPDFKTLCRFRVENEEAVSEVLVRFRLWCEEAGLYGKEEVAIDGSKFRAVNSTERNVTQAKLEKRIKRERESVERYLADLEEADSQDRGESAMTAEELKQKIATIGEHLKKQEEMLSEMKENGETQRSLTDPESRLMKTAKGSYVGYNIQTAVDSKHKLIAEVMVTNECTDYTLLPEMAKRAKDALGVKELTVSADGGFFGFEAIKACEDEEGITAHVPIRENNDAERRGMIPRDRFKYDAERDVYFCPAGAEMRKTGKYIKKNRVPTEYFVYKTKQCKACPLRSQCTTSKNGREIKRWVHHEVLDRLSARLARQPEILKRRKSIVEHPFGTIKVGMGHERLLLKGIKKVGTEIKLTVLSYNFKRVMSILGSSAMIEMFKCKNAMKKAGKTIFSPALC